MDEAVIVPVETRAEALDVLQQAIELRQGGKATEIIAEGSLVKRLEQFSIPDLLDTLVEESRIIEIEYVVPSVPFRIKSFYLPAGTQVHVAQSVPRIPQDQQGENG